MSVAPIRAAVLLLAGSFGLAACNDGYGYGGMSVGYGAAGYCDPRWDDCYYNSGYDRYGYGGYGYGGAYDPWWGWYGDYYYPGVGFYIYDRGGRRHRWDDNTRRYWEGRRHHYQGRDWNDRRWQRWDGYRGGNNWDGRRDRNRDGDWDRRRDGNRGDGNWNRGDGQRRGDGSWNRGDGTSNRGDGTSGRSWTPRGGSSGTWNSDRRRRPRD